jgi:hypothetical protein
MKKITQDKDIVTVRNNGNIVKVRKMTDEEIDNSSEQWYCDDESGTCYAYSELDFSQSRNAVIDEVLLSVNRLIRINGILRQEPQTKQIYDLRDKIKALKETK